MIPTLRDAAQQALAAMEHAHDESLNENHFECRQILIGQITALRAALAEDAMQRLMDVQQEMEQEPEHITDGRPCWCEPELDYKDPETGAEVWVHRRTQ